MWERKAAFCMRAVCWAYGGMADWSLIVCVGDVGDWCNTGRAAGSHTQSRVCVRTTTGPHKLAVPLQHWGSFVPTCSPLKSHFFPPFSLPFICSSTRTCIFKHWGIMPDCIWSADKLERKETLVYCDGCDVSYKCMCVCVRVSAQDMNITPPSVACQKWSQCIHGEECADWMMTGANWPAERQWWPNGIASQFPSGLKTQTSHWTDTQAHHEWPPMCVFLQIPV